MSMNDKLSLLISGFAILMMMLAVTYIA